MAVSINDLLDIRGMGQKTLDEIVTKIVRLHYEREESLETHHLGGQPLEPVQSAELLEGGPTGVSQVPTSVIQDLLLVARWRKLQGRASEPLMMEISSDPSDIRDALHRLQSMPSTQVISEAEPGAAAMLAADINSYDPAWLLVLRKRVLVARDVRPTLDELGRELGVTRERVRQIEKAVVTKMQDRVRRNEDLARLQDSVVSAIGSLTPLELLVDELPALADRVSPVDTPVWMVLQALSSEYGVEDGWCSVPTVTDRVTETRAIVEDLTGQLGVLSLDSFEGVDWAASALNEGWLESWLSHCEIPVSDGHVIRSMSKLGDRAVAAIAIAGHPLGIDEMPAFVLGDRSRTSLTNALAVDDRIVRVDRKRWALRLWGFEAYGGISEAIGRIVDERGGQASIRELLDSICGRFEVAESSVWAYAVAYPFQSVGGVVSRADKAKESRKSWRQTRRFYARGEQWLLRLMTTNDHLRGSGSQCPSAVAQELGAEPQGNLAFSDGSYQLRVYRTGIQPHFGSLKSFLDRDGIGEGEEVFLVFGPGSKVAIERVPDPSIDPLPRACQLVGKSGVGNTYQCLQRLREAIGLGVVASASVLWECYQSRGDSDVAELIMRWMTSTGGVPAEASQRPTTAEDEIDEILGLL